MNRLNASIPFSTYRIPILGLLFFSLYIFGILFPDIWWGTHFLAFMPTVSQATLLLVSLALILTSAIQPEQDIIPPSASNLFSRNANGLILILSLLCGVLMYHFPIVMDTYGDAYKIFQRLDDMVSEIPAGTTEALFSFDLSPWAGHSSILALLTYLAYYFEITYREAFMWMDAICGSLFVGIWLAFVRYSLKQTSWQIILALAGISAPFMLLFFGHMESYAPVFLLFLSWGIGVLLFCQTNDKRFLWGLLALLPFCIKLHPIALLFVPTLGLLFLSAYGQSSRLTDLLLNWRGTSKYVLAPIFLIGAILYFFVFEDHVDTRTLTETAMEFDRLFLPLLTPEAPLDRYNLLSFNHIFDFGNEILLWSPIALFMLGGILLQFSTSIRWNSLSVLSIGLAMILLTSLLFVVNPLLSMQMDWDLMAIPAPFFLLFVLTLVQQIERSSHGTRFLPISLALCLLTLPNFLLHAQVDAHSQRLESLGIRMYHSYYEWSGTVLQRALDMPTYHSRQAYEERKTQLLQKLQPHNLPGKDFEYARLLLNEGKYHLRKAQDPEKALNFLQEAEYYHPTEKNVLLFLMETNFVMQQYQEAFAYSEKLIQIQYPSEQKSIAIAIQCALEAKLYQEALELSALYVSKWNDRPIFQEVHRRLQTQTNVESLPLLFAKNQH